MTMKLDPYFSLGVFTFETLRYTPLQTDDRLVVRSLGSENLLKIL